MTFADAITLGQHYGVPGMVLGIAAYFLFMHMRASKDKPLTADSLSRRLQNIEMRLDQLDECCDDMEMLKERTADLPEIRKHLWILWDRHLERQRERDRGGGGGRRQ